VLTRGQLKDAEMGEAAVFLESTTPKHHSTVSNSRYGEHRRRSTSLSVCVQACLPILHATGSNS
jgi:hypothetical protein